MQQKPVLTMTLTGEVYLPVRLIYQVRNMEKLQQQFAKLSCMTFDEEKERWVWLYQDEAKALKFAKSYAALPKETRPIVLGSFYQHDGLEIHLDVGSCARASAAVVFFNKHIRRSVLEVTHCAIYCRILEQGEHPGPNFDSLFSTVNTADIEAKLATKVAKLMVLMQSGLFPGAIQDTDFELVESFPVHFYEDGIDTFKTTLIMRETVALKRWQGDKTFNMGKLIHQIVHK